ncbi:MAG: HEAT repeat domain-containing protein [Gimesia chilikensis]
MPGLIFRMCFFLISTVFAFNCQLALAADPPDIPTLIKQLDDPDSQKRENAADKLADFMDPRITEAAKKRLLKENDFHVRLVLHYALASQGNRKAFEPLIDSLHQTGHHGSNYLRRATGKDFGWDIKRWQKWFESVSDKEFRQFIKRRWERKPMMDEWSEFASLYSKRYFNSALDGKVDEFFGPFTKEDQKKLKSLPTAKAWDLFESALQQLQNKGNRKEAARLFHIVATEYSDTYYADQSKELANLLDQMVLEDQKYKLPQDIQCLSIPEQITYHIYQLRNLVAYQFSQPGYPLIFGLPRFEDDEEEYNPAVELRKIGEPAVPFLLNLLEDRRPIRSVSYWRYFVPTRNVLRYQDVAVAVLEEIRPDIGVDFTRYYSTKDPVTKKLIIERIKSTQKQP